MIILRKVLAALICALFSPLIFNIRWLPNVYNAIFYERRMEFTWEPTGAFSDLNRRGRFMDFIKANRADYANIQVDTKPWLKQQVILLPIPQGAYDVNKSLVQNPGYPAF